ncbi:MAG TPA: hypothetical protein H9974_08535 [Candidatus Dorea intestinigallinarum]|nr:hypothetical protein [Candidatus Dorea intestinigallinarum]
MAYETYAERFEGAPTEEEKKLAAFSADRTEVENQISSAENQKTLLECYSAVKEFERAYSQEYATLELKKSLLGRIETVLEQSAGEERELAVEADKLQAQSFPDPPEELHRINIQADQYLLQLYSSLGTNVTQNKLTISKAIKQATNGDGNRVTATALLKLMQNPSYKPYFASTDKERILTAARSPLWKSLDIERNKRLEGVRKKQAEAVMRVFHLRHLRDMVKRTM